MNGPIEILYTAEATVEGGREGQGRTSDGRIVVNFDVPSEMGGTGGPGTNPEQLFALGVAACFQSSTQRFAAMSNLDLSNQSHHVARRDRTARDGRPRPQGRARPRRARNQP